MVIKVVCYFSYQARSRATKTEICYKNYSPEMGKLIPKSMLVFFLLFILCVCKCLLKVECGLPCIINSLGKVRTQHTLSIDKRKYEKEFNRDGKEK